MPNVLLLVADDLGKQLGCYGCPYTKTPHIDRLAVDAVRFDNAFASTASCSGSRSTIYTGMHTHQNGQYGLQSGKHHFMTFDHVDTGPAVLARHGYLTAIVGKVHVGPDSAYPWEHRAESLTRDVFWSADRAADVFAAAKATSRPFWLTVAFHDPHRSHTRAGFGNEEPVDDRIQKATYRPEDVVVPNFLTDSPGVRTELASYSEAISRLDQGVGHVLLELEQAGLAQDTLVIFISDNGPPFLNSKTTLFDAGIRLPLIVRHPGLPGSVNPNLVSFVDVLPTILDWTIGAAALTEKNERSGRSFLPILGATEPLSAWDHVLGSHTFHEATNYWPTRYIRTRRFKYHRNIAWRLDFPFSSDIYGSLTWEDVRNAETSPKMIGQRPLRDYFFRPPEQLFDLESDPAEVRDLAKDPAYADVLKDLRDCLEDWQRRTNDPWLYRDGISLLQNKYHLDAGLKIPDRWDVDVDHPETTGDFKAYVNRPFGV
ncbi:n-sulfoglucosamine sulfohydrolase [Grosmannia clavigera kw1407]|uniref:N-sulfoglucosamine sulfohydrolase n=1 Tax=Grosmannia clavigera (strain kw1407 / UAMH 11150) TaxID=655863 RepID=F0X9L3_GROCL|nr:n-sulfoglucosamine sulfohydrolase [Grosmannia clavigera kw1407]EFX05697.1 n-sulfoglucosamine sulfohydrolase [Grosmannia clavigera kw1407]